MSRKSIYPCRNPFPVLDLKSVFRFVLDAQRENHARRLIPLNPEPGFPETQTTCQNPDSGKCWVWDSESYFCRRVFMLALSYKSEQFLYFLLSVSGFRVVWLSMIASRSRCFLVPIEEIRAVNTTTYSCCITTVQCCTKYNKIILE